MHAVGDLLAKANSWGIWSALSFFVQVGGGITALVYLFRSRRRLTNVNFAISIAQGNFVEADGRAVNQFTVHVRNMTETDLIIGALHVKVSDRIAFAEYANGNSPTNEYELRFLEKDNEWNNGYALIKSGYGRTTWLPASTDLQPKEIIQKLEGKEPVPDASWRGKVQAHFARPKTWLICRVVLLQTKPHVFNMKIPVRNIQIRLDGTEYGRSIEQLSVPAQQTTR